MEVNKYPAILLISHGPLCRGLLESTQMIYGKADRMEALSLEEGMNPKEFEKQLRNLIEKYDNNVFVMVDILGGTPFNTLAKIARDTRLYGMAGMNMPMLMEVLINRVNCDVEKLASTVLEAMLDTKYDLTEFLQRAYNK